jgi:putative transposase
MPDHFHGIIQIRNCSPSTQIIEKYRKGSAPGSLSTIIQTFKSLSSRRVNALRKTSIHFWQRNYYEHIIRTEKSLNLIRLYIEFNPTLLQHDSKLGKMEPPSLGTNRKNFRAIPKTRLRCVGAKHLPLFAFLGMPLKQTI